MNEKEPVESKICKVCGISKSLKSYYSAPRNADGRMLTCKICFGQKKKEERAIIRERAGYKYDHINIQGTQKRDYVAMYELLQNMGYNLCEDIHIQFSSKYNLPIKERPNERKKQKYNPKNLELC